MIYVRLAENATTGGFSCECDSIVEAMAVVHHYVYADSNRTAEIVNTEHGCLWCDYTNNGNFLADAMTDTMFERFYNCTLTSLSV